jgi:hypothetical protein
LKHYALIAVKRENTFRSVLSGSLSNLILIEDETKFNTANSDNPSPIVDASGERGDLLVRGFWENSMDAIINVRCVDTDAKSYNSREPEKVLKSAEKVEKNKYLDHCLQQRRAFTPFIISVDGLLGYEANNLLKRLAFHIAEKWQKPYSVTCGLVKSGISLACVRATHQCLRGSRIPFRTISQHH